MSNGFGLQHDTGASNRGSSTLAGRPRILLADDAVAARVLTSALLRRMGFEVDVVEDGEAALALARSARYDLILLDLDMPGMDGITTARNIRMRSGPDWRTPIVALSAYLSDAAMASERRRLFDAAVAKPVTSQTLHRAISDALAKAGGRAAPAGSSVASGSEAPLVDLAALEAMSPRTRPDAWKATLATMIEELRQAVSRLESAAAKHDRDLVMRSCGSLMRTSAAAAPRLAERAGSLAAAAPQLALGELSARAGEVTGCAVATLGKLNKLAHWR